MIVERRAGCFHRSDARFSVMAVEPTASQQRVSQQRNRSDDGNHKPHCKPFLTARWVPGRLRPNRGGRRASESPWEIIARNGRASTPAPHDRTISKTRKTANFGVCSNITEGRATNNATV